MSDGTDAQSLYDRVGGMPFFVALAARFYEGVRADPVLNVLYPEAELDAAEDRLKLFLAQYWGGPTTYSEARGHPRLRMRHAPFVIGAAQRDAWLRHMTAAVEESDAGEADKDELHAYFAMAAQHMVNAG